MLFVRTVNNVEMMWIKTLRVAKDQRFSGEVVQLEPFGGGKGAGVGAGGLGD
jgi:hypothetical protein